MPHFRDNELYCTECGSTRKYPECCGKAMDWDSVVFFCSICGKEVKPIYCCNKQMSIRQLVKNLKKELFSDL